jgi:uncharacterized SAM-dependent methyltransferase
MKSGSNNGGHFSLIEIGCGTSCIFAFLIDAVIEEWSISRWVARNYQLQLL